LVDLVPRLILLFIGVGCVLLFNKLKWGIATLLFALPTAGLAWSTFELAISYNDTVEKMVQIILMKRMISKGHAGYDRIVFGKPSSGDAWKIRIFTTREYEALNRPR
jgi:hypothetical protein